MIVEILQKNYIEQTCEDSDWLNLSTKNPQTPSGIKTNNHENSIKHEYFIVSKYYAKILY